MLGTTVAQEYWSDTGNGAAASDAEALQLGKGQIDACGSRTRTTTVTTQAGEEHFSGSARLRAGMGSHGHGNSSGESSGFSSGSSSKSVGAGAGADHSVDDVGAAVGSALTPADTDLRTERNEDDGDEVFIPKDLWWRTVLASARYTLILLYRWSSDEMLRDEMELR